MVRALLRKSPSNKATMVPKRLPLYVLVLTCLMHSSSVFDFWSFNLSYGSAGRGLEEGNDANNDNESTTGDLSRDIQFLEQELANSSLRYYMYQDPIMERLAGKQLILKGGGKRTMLKRYGGEIRSEIYFLNVLKEHQAFQVADPHQADLYIIPLSLGATLAVAPQGRSSGDYNEAFGALYNQSLFQATQGHKHVLFSLLVPFHKFKDRGQIRQLGLEPHYRKLWNVTVVNDNCWAGNKELVSSGMAAGNDFEEDWKKQANHLARYSFSMGLPSAKGHIPLVPASRQRFENSTFFVFFHTREAPSYFNSTQYRKALIHAQERGELEAFPPTSIGYELPPEEWMQQFMSSKFCLVMRGDTVHSHSLLRSVRVGCIPVVVSDHYSLYAPTFKSSIDMSNFAIFLKEDDFLEDPVRELRKLQDLTNDEINVKLQWLAYAQRIFFPDHEESLFVQAFLREAHIASRTDLGGIKFPYK